MPIIYSYPTITPTTGDLLILSDVSASGKPTKTADISSVFDLLGDTGISKVTVGEIAANGGDIAITGIPGTVGIGKTIQSRDDTGNIQWQPGVLTAEVTLTPTNLLNLHTTPILLLATPSPTANISILGAWFFLTWAGPAYNSEEIVIEDIAYGTTIYSTVNTPVASTFQGGRTMPISRTLPTGNLNWTTSGIQISTTGSLGAGGSSITISIVYILLP